jgi:hypothetical protein
VTRETCQESPPDGIQLVEISRQAEAQVQRSEVQQRLFERDDLDALDVAGEVQRERDELSGKFDGPTPC